MNLIHGIRRYNDRSTQFHSADSTELDFFFETEKALGIFSIILGRQKLTHFVLFVLLALATTMITG